MADAINGTLITPELGRIRSINFKEYPKIVLAVHLFKIYSEENSNAYWNAFRYSTKGRLFLQQTDSTPMNFAYCDTPKLVQTKPWHVDTLTFGIQFKVWVVLAGMIVLVTLVLFFEGNGKVSVFNILLSTASSLIYPSEIKEFKRSILFCLWTVTTFVLSNHYLGTNTGFVIIPPKENPLTKISHLVENNYTFIFDSPGEIPTLEGVLKMHGKGPQKQNLEIKSSQIILQKTFQNLEKAILKNKESFLDTLTFGKKKAVFSSWFTVVGLLNDANEYLKKLNRQNEKHCYLGKSLVPIVEVFVVITPPKSDKLYVAAQRMSQAGLKTLWEKVIGQSKYAKRVQDQLKVISPTHIIYDFESQTGSLKIQGKVMVIFFLWGFILLFSVVFFFIEIFVHYKMLRTEITNFNELSYY